MLTKIILGEFHTIFILLLLVRHCGMTVISDILEIPDHVDIIHISGIKLNTSDITCQSFSVNYYFNYSSIGFALNRIHGYNYGQILIHIEPRNMFEFYNELNEVINFTLKPKLNRYWSPMFVISYPLKLPPIFESSPLKALEFWNISIKSDIYILTTFGNKSIFWDIYTIGKLAFHHMLRPIAGSDKILWYSFMNKISRRSDFRGAEITATAANDPAFYLESKFTNDSQKFQSGLAVHRFWFMRDALNFTERAILGEWTSETENGSLTGSGIQVINGKVDIGISQIPMTNTKKVHIDFLQPTDDKTLKIFFVQPQATYHHNIYLMPFQIDVWISITVAWIILVILIRIVVRLKSRVFQQSYENDTDFSKEAFMWAIGTVTQKGWHIIPSSYSLRLIHFVAHLTGLICFTAFTASIVAFLSVKSFPLKSIDDLLNASYKIQSNGNSTPVMYFIKLLQAQSGFPNDVIVNEKVSIPRAMDTNSVTRCGVVAFAYVFYIEARGLNFTDASLCKVFDSLPILNVPLRNGMIVRKGSPFRKFFNHKIILMKERGINHRFKVTYITETEASCLNYMSGQRHSLGTEDVVSALYILILGSFFGVFILVVEFIFRRNLRSKFDILRRRLKSLFS